MKSVIIYTVINIFYCSIIRFRGVSTKILGGCIFMKKILTLEQLSQLIGDIIEDKTDFIYSIKPMNDDSNVFKIYDKIIKLASSHFNVEVNIIGVPFSMKFDLVSVIVNKINGEAGTIAFLEKIFNTPFDSESKLLTEIKNDLIACSSLANFSYLIDNYDWTYQLLNYIYDNINDIPKTHYPIIIHHLAFLLESLCLVIQKKLYNDVDSSANNGVTIFNSSFMQIGSRKKEDVIVYQLLLSEHQEILKLHKKTITILNRLQIRHLILI